MSSDRARLFFALNPGHAVRAEVAGIQSRAGLGGRAVDPANFHVTLAFLGQVPVERIPELLKLAVALALPACTLRFDRVGSFTRARVGWLGCTQVPPMMVEFQGLLEHRLHEAGFNTDNRPWKPHITLYRNLRKPCDTMEIEALYWELKDFCLMQSMQDRKGVSYRTIGHWPVEK